MTSTRCGISAKQLERELGVGYKTAWRMFHLIRGLLAENVTDLSGTVEIDETYIGGVKRQMRGETMSQLHKRRYDAKVRVQGMVERGGRVRADVSMDGPLLPNVLMHVVPSAMIYTDETPAYKRLTVSGYAHRRVHHTSKVYVSGDVHTNTIEGFWSLVKRGISGVYHSVSKKYLQMYFDEYIFRYNHRDDDVPMFDQVLGRAIPR
jgi:transposase-like protein